MKSGKVVRVCKNVGDEIHSGEPLVAVEENKKTIDIYSNAEGIIKEINVKEGDKVKLGQLLVLIEGEIVEQKEVKKESKGSFNYFEGIMSPIEEEIETKVTIIGSGPGGYVAAIKLAQMGADVVIVEKDSIGGTCLNRGCIPTKALVRSAEIYKNIQDANKYGCFSKEHGVNMDEVISRKDNIVAQLTGGIEHLLGSNNVKIITGVGEIVDENTVFVKSKRKETTIKTEDIIIATGSTVSRLPIPGIELDNVLKSDEALELIKLPEEIVIIGGGVIGMEFAFIYNSLGSKVTIVEFMPNILPSLDEDVQDTIREIAEDRGIKIYTDSKVDRILDDENHKCIVEFTNGEKKFISTEKVLVSVGRQPYIEGLNLEKVKVELNENKKGVKVDHKMRTNIPNIYAIGDATGQVQLAHVASAQGIVAAKNIMGKESVIDYSNIPSAIFTDPEIATIGIDEKTAAKENIDVEIGKFPFMSNGKALTYGSTEGFVKIIVEKDSKKVIGAAIIGPNATDLINEVSIAISNELTIDYIIDTIHPHPTTSESIFEAALAAEGMCIHN
ncbi:dihydrolipoyl dehydrogenase [Anaerosalibacter massiliensis]|uniref:Dihydrolipoyl dehydrogenase n=1 Tax=Anaerosalibacter massiliensis TaxID=1347392 RepID=A0A9X2S5I5_9FIRM|nr:dihydrolipoyl dehydrogenase [Anaerosalibacter massiliensis]MCR2044354.1 dihydrolipoyl dehydrogenase [Anaerosalibacter massiliensis]